MNEKQNENRIPASSSMAKELVNFKGIPSEEEEVERVRIEVGSDLGIFNNPLYASATYLIPIKSLINKIVMYNRYKLSLESKPKPKTRPQCCSFVISPHPVRFSSITE